MIPTVRTYLPCKQYIWFLPTVESQGSAQELRLVDLGEEGELEEERPHAAVSGYIVII